MTGSETCTSWASRCRPGTPGRSRVHQSTAPDLPGPSVNVGLSLLPCVPGGALPVFIVRAGEAAASGRKKARPEDVVRLGLDAFQKNRPSVVHGFANFVATFSLRLFSRAFVLKLMARLTAPKQPALPAAAS
jgi:uncharacterized protein